ncbi:HAD family hydrolase [Breznakiella homolactica]|uniref:HAD family hydrolase n=1 Tax=Breznakiella homolactica TaxID=2798577 RepID=A0A7T8B8Z3_9SPIR|nr:HAD family hydrolase [Breznakiella homolactica]QQO07907.1 HAD family hydrolase [Breznakiella homolactica]
MKEIKLVVSDLDDTFLNKEKTVIPELIRCVEELKERNILFSFISGRPPYGIQPYAEQVPVTGPLVGCNGAVIYRGDLVLARHSFSLGLLREIMEKSAALGMTVLFYSGDTEYTLSETEWTRDRFKGGRSLPVKSMSPGDWKTMTAEKVNIMSPPGGMEFSVFRKELEPLLSLFSVALYDGFGCEIAAPGINKAEGLRELCSIVKVPMENTLAVGDNANDLEMVREAGIGAAVANAVEPVRNAADYVCQNQYGLGVLEAIRRFCF